MREEGMTSVARNQYLNLTGGLVAIAGLAFVVASLVGNWSEIDFALVDTGLVGALVAIALVYAMSNMLLADAWGRLLRVVGEDQPRRWVRRVYAVTQLGKYIPGNIFQFAGRQVVAVSAGLRGRAVAKSAVLEIALLAFAGSLFAVPFFLAQNPPFIPLLPIAVFCGAVATAGTVLWTAWQRDASIALLLYVAFLSLSGVLFAMLFRALEGPADHQALFVLAPAFVLAWLAGLATPGAPAGVGVRELALLVMLQGQFDKPTVILAVALSRLTTIAGDLIFVGAVVTAQRVSGRAE